MSAISDFVEPTKTIIAETKSVLEAAAGDNDDWNVRVLTLTDPLLILKTIVNESRIPAVMIFFSRATYPRQVQRPRRVTNIRVVVVDRNKDQREAATAAQDYGDSVIALLDEHILNQAKWEVLSVTAVPVGSGRAAYDIEFQVRDY